MTVRKKMTWELTIGGSTTAYHGTMQGLHVVQFLEEI